MSAPERIWAWVWALPYPSKSNGKAEWNAVMYPSEQSCTEYLRADLAAAQIEAARRDAWEAAMKAAAWKAYVTCAETRHAALGEKCSVVILAIPYPGEAHD
jgi:hypothetical protein